MFWQNTALERSSQKYKHRVLSSVGGAELTNKYDWQEDDVDQRAATIVVLRDHPEITFYRTQVYLGPNLCVCLSVCLSHLRDDSSYAYGLNFWVLCAFGNVFIKVL